jgi:hypothetical protein
MNKRQGNIIEAHIEKAVLIIAALASVYIMIAFVIRSPGIEINGKELRPGQIDTYISEKAETLRQQLSRAPSTSISYEPCSPAFIKKLSGSWPLDANIVWPVPRVMEARIRREYQIPKVGEVNNISVEHIRAAAYVPNTEITPENADKAESYEVSDIDLVTVEGNFDLGQLIDSFKESFAGETLPEEWRDEELSRPVFAAVGLERQQLGEDGQWSPWEAVPRAKIEPEAKLFKIPEEANELPGGGITVQILKMAAPARQARLLQPEPYQIASGDDDWFPPTLHKKYLAILHDRELQERRDAIATAKEQEQSRRPDRRARGERTPAGGGGGMNMDAMMKSMTGMGGGGGAVPTTPARTSRQGRERRPEQSATEKERQRVVKQNTEPTLSDELDKMLLSKKDISKIQEPITFWAYDDTAIPGSTYRYRVRMGVFNPVAGTGEVRGEDKALANKVILWGAFSEVTNEVEIPKRLYFFPMNVNETTKSVDWMVSKYVMGYWYSDQFPTKRGEAIGKTAEVKPESEQTESGNTEAQIPEQIDYTTGAILVDVAATQDWTGGKNLSVRPYFNVLYSYDGSKIEETAAKVMNWPDKLRARYNEIKSLEKKPKEALRAWSRTYTLARRTLSQPLGPTRQPTGPGGQQAPADTDGMMRMMMEMQRQMSPQQ